MSYCVKCGVELDESAQKCVLCDTPVYYPRQEQSQGQKPYADVPVIPENMKKKYIACIVSVIMLIPNIVCVLVNLFLHSGGLWSVYVLSSSFLIWVVFVLPFLQKKIRPYWMWGFDTLAGCIYTYVFYAMNSEDNGWYYRVALPILLGVSLCVLAFILWSRKKRHWTAVMIHLFSDVCFMSLLIGAVLAFISCKIGLLVCIIVFLSAVCMLGLYVYCYKSRRMRAWLSKKFFF